MFGALKRKFPLPANALEFNIETQLKLVLAISALFNAIRKYAPDTLSLGAVQQLLYASTSVLKHIHRAISA